MNYIGTGLSLVTLGLEAGMDLPDLTSVLDTDTLGGDAGTYDANADAAEYGTLSFCNKVAASGTSISVYLHYAAGANFATGVLHKVNRETGVDSTQSLSTSGSLIATGLTAGNKYDFYVVASNAAGLIGSVSNIVTLNVDDKADVGADFLTVYWRKNMGSEWESKAIGTDVKRRSIHTNIRGHTFQWRLHCDAQNVRLKIRNVKLHVRQNGRSRVPEQT